MKPNQKIPKKGNECECFKYIDKAIRVGRASYKCFNCEQNVSVIWFFYQIALKHL